MPLSSSVDHCPSLSITLSDCCHGTLPAKNRGVQRSCKPIKSAPASVAEVKVLLVLRWLTTVSCCCPAAQVRCSDQQGHKSWLPATIVFVFTNHLDLAVLQVGACLGAWAHGPICLSFSAIHSHPQHSNIERELRMEKWVEACMSMQIFAPTRAADPPTLGVFMLFK